MRFPLCAMLSETDKDNCSLFLPAFGAPLSPSLMPAIAYVLDMYHRTNGAYGVNEVILASALAAIVFPVFSVQPLTFVGVTGLINLVSSLPHVFLCHQLPGFSVGFFFFFFSVLQSVGRWCP